MDYEEIEKKLKEDAANIGRKDFSVRWKAIEGKLCTAEAEERQSVPASVPVAATADGGCDRGVERFPVKLIFLFAAAFLIIAFVVLVPFILSNRNNKFYAGGGYGLYGRNVDRTEFYEGVESAGMRLVDLSDYDIDAYFLHYAEDDTVKGGSFSFIGEGADGYISVDFYDVSIGVAEPMDYKIYEIGDTEIKYNLKYANGYYTGTARAVHEGVIYRLDYSLSDGNVLEIFDSFFR